MLHDNVVPVALVPDDEKRDGLLPYDAGSDAFILLIRHLISHQYFYQSASLIH